MSKMEVEREGSGSGKGKGAWKGSHVRRKTDREHPREQKQFTEAFQGPLLGR